MAVIDIKINPTKKDLWVFSILWVAFFVLLAKMVFWKPEALLIAASVTGLAFLISIAFNKGQPKRIQLLGMIIPLTLLAIGGAERGLGVNPWTIVWILIAIGAIGGIAIFASPKLGTSLYVHWMYAALPLGWTFSHLILGIVFFLVMAPIGFILRATGKDPMERSFDRAAASYWIRHEQVTDPARYFRQF
jgi:Saxitoxin biosynthesis operon protein SxtJ